MSDLLNQASLVMVPSGYKEDTVYSVVPSDGSGDLSFTRSSNGTRVNSAGLVEVVPWNAMQYSEDFANAVWGIPNGGSSVVVTSNATTAPNGTTTADKIEIANGTNDRIEQVGTAPILTSGLQCTFSVYIKSISGTGKVGIRSGQSGASSVFSYTNEWQRLTWTFNALGTYEIPQFCNSTLVGGADSAPSFFAWGAQLNIGSTAKPYFPTTDRLNVPRLTYQNGGGGCPSLLLEKQSTNLLLYSEQFDQWATNGTTTSNVAISPDGTQNADRLNYTSGNVYWLDAAVNVTNGVDYTYSLYVKPTSIGDQFRFYIDGAFNVSTTITTDSSDWKRYTYTFTASATGSINPHILLGYGTTSQNTLVWGAQLEASSYPTSYIPTTSSSATRVADAMTVNLPNTNMAFTAYLECEEAPLATTAGDWFAIFNNVSPLGRAYGYSNLFGFADLYSVGETSAPKMVWKQESGTTAKIFKNGVLVGTSTTGAYALAFNRFAIYTQFLDKPLKVKQFVFFDNALTDAECAQLTA